MERMIAGLRELRVLGLFSPPSPAALLFYPRKSQTLNDGTLRSLKAQLLARLAKLCIVRFSDALGAEWFAQLASARRVIRCRFRRPVPTPERIPGRQAEALDSVVHEIAVHSLVKADLVRRENELRVIVSAPVLPAVIRSAWMDL
jgi:hypothetical protein